MYEEVQSGNGVRGFTCRRQEHRQKCREALYCNYRVFDLNTNKVAGYITDISLEGARLMTESPVSRGEARRFRIDLPKRSSEDGSFRSRTSICIDAISQWSSEDERTSFYDCGFRFVNVDSAMEELLSELINDCHR